MTLTALVGALVALVARPPEPQRTKDQEEIARLKRSHAQLIDRIETLELENEGLGRELAAERHLSTHWIGEASRFAGEAREQRERGDLFRDLANGTQQYRPQQQLLGQNPQAALNQALQQALANAQQAYAQCNYQPGLSQQGQQMVWRGDDEGFCNCVPSRTQMFDAMVAQLDNERR
jgi:hypothetical protein